MKMRLTIILVLELIVAVLMVGAGVHLDRLDTQKAFNAWGRNPTQETRAELDRQQRITVLYNWVFLVALFGVMAVPTIPLVVILERRKSKHLP